MQPALHLYLARNHISDVFDMCEGFLSGGQDCWGRSGFCVHRIWRLSAHWCTLPGQQYRPNDLCT